MKNKKSTSSNQKPRSKGFKPSMRGKQSRADNKDPRVNFDNERKSKFDQFEKLIEEGSKDGGRNDISTWNGNQQLLKAAGSLPFSTIIGDKYGEGGESVPGIMTFAWSPSLGASDDVTAFNKTFEAMYSYMVHANSRNYKYDFPDLAMYVVGGNEVFAAIAEAMRIYGIFKTYDVTNRYLVDSLVSALNWDPGQARKDLSKMWFGINDLILQTRQIWLPTTIPVLNRWIDMNSHVYTDAPGARSQMYAFVRTAYWMVGEKVNEQGTCLIPATYYDTTNNTNKWTEFNRNINYAGGSLNPSTSMNWDTFYGMVSNMINNLVASQDRGSLYGDILQAYGKEKIFAMPEVTADYSVKPEYNASILAQIENLTTTQVYQRFVTQSQFSNLHMEPVWYTTKPLSNGGTVTQPYPSSTSKITWKECATLGMARNQILNVHIAEQPTPEFVMEATRLKAGPIRVVNNAAQVTSLTFDTTGQTPNNVTKIQVNGGLSGSGIGVPMALPESAGTELFHTVAMWRFNGTLGLQAVEFHINDTQPSSAEASTYGLLMAYDWHPFVYHNYNAWPDVSTTTSIIYGADLVFAAGDYDNYIELAAEELRKLHSTAVYSAFGIPQLMA